MKFSVRKEIFAHACSVVAKALTPNNTQPLLSCIYITADSGVLELQATNLITYIKTSIPAHVEDPGEVVVSGKIMLDIMKVLPDAALTLTSTPSQTTLVCDRSSYKLNVLNAQDYQEFIFPDYDVESSVELPHKLVKSMVERVYKATSKDESRPILKGISLTVDNNVVRMVASDTFRVAVCDTHTETSALTERFELIVPGSSFYDFLSLVDGEESVYIATAKGQIVLKSGTTSYLTRGIEGTFIDYTKLLPAEYSVTVELATDDFTGSIRRVSPMSRAAGSTQRAPIVYFKFDPEGGLLTISSGNTDQGIATETLDAAITGEEIDISFNSQTFSEGLSSINEKTLHFEIGTLRARHVGLIKSSGEINYLYLIMPNIQR